MADGGAMAREMDGGAPRRRWRAAFWGGSALALLLPALAMQVTDEVAWDAADFAMFGAMLAAAGGACELATRTARDRAYRAALGVALATAFLLVWLNLAVGLIGSEDNPANLLYGAVLAVGLCGAAVARARPRGMARALVAAAVAQALVAALALFAGEHRSPPSSAAELLGLNGIFVAAFLASAWLFRRSARDRAGARAA